MQNSRQVTVYDQETRQFTFIDTCFGTHHLNFAEDANNTLWLSNNTQNELAVVGWVNTKLFWETGDASKSQGWTPLIVDTNGNGKRDAYVEPNQPQDPTKDKRIGLGFYGIAYSPADGSIWGSNLGFPGYVLRLNLGPNPSETALVEVYKVPEPGFGMRGFDVDRQGVAWVALASGHMASFDRRKCKGLNGPGRRRGTCVRKAGRSIRSRDPDSRAGMVPPRGPYYTWVDQHDILGLARTRPSGPAISLIHCTRWHGKIVELRVPYPMGFFAKGVDGRIDDPNAGWKGKGLWVTSGNRAPAHIEGIDAPVLARLARRCRVRWSCISSYAPIHSRIEAPGVEGRAPTPGKPTAPAISMRRWVFAWGAAQGHLVLDSPSSPWAFAPFPPDAGGGDQGSGAERPFELPMRILPEGLFVLGRWCGFPRRPIGDLEQAWRAYVQVRARRWREEQHEPLPLVRLDRDLVDFLVYGQHRRPHRPLGWITQLDLFGHQCADAQYNDGALMILPTEVRGCVVQVPDGALDSCPAGACVARPIGVILTTILNARIKGMRRIAYIRCSPASVAWRLSGVGRRYRAPDRLSCMQARSMPPLLPPPTPRRTASPRETRQARCALIEERRRKMSILSHYERVDTWGRGGRQGLAPQVPGDLALAHTPSSTMRPSLGRAPRCGPPVREVCVTPGGAPPYRAPSVRRAPPSARSRAPGPRAPA